MLGRIAWLSFLFPRFVMQRIMPELVDIALQSYFYFQILDISVKVFLCFPFYFAVYVSPVLSLLWKSNISCLFFISLKIGLKAEKW